jgi:hypothetical protein
MADETPMGTPQQWPGVGGVCEYSERLEIGYRWWDAHNATPRFAFGHGESYTVFAYAYLSIDSTSAAPNVVVSWTVANSGARDGKEVKPTMLFRPDDNTWAGLTDVGFRVGRFGQLEWQGTKRSSPTTPWSSPIVHCDLDAVGSEVEAQLDLATRHVLVRMMNGEGNEDLHRTLHTLGIVDRQARIRGELCRGGTCQLQSVGRGLERKSDAATHLSTLGDGRTGR